MGKFQSSDSFFQSFNQQFNSTWLPEPCCVFALTSSYHTLYSNATDINLLSKLVDSLVGIFIGVRIDIRTHSREFD